MNEILSIFGGVFCLIAFIFALYVHFTTKDENGKEL